MPSGLHETLVDMFRHRPTLAAALLGDVLGVELPAHRRAVVESAELPDLNPAEYRADAVVVLRERASDDVEVPVLAVVVEVQLGRDPDKWWTWPVYVINLRNRWRCPAALLVVCVDAAVAEWCATPIELGPPGAVVIPLVVGPGRVPVVTDVAQALREPELAVLSAMAHGSHPDRDSVLEAMFGALANIDGDRAGLYCDVVLAALPEAARGYLEALMRSRTYEYQSDFARRYFFEGKAEGEARGEARAVLTVLAARGVDVPEPARNRITECADVDQLDTWVRRAATATSIGDLFD